MFLVGFHYATRATPWGLDVKNTDLLQFIVILSSLKKWVSCMANQTTITTVIFIAFLYDSWNDCGTVLIHVFVSFVLWLYQERLSKKLFCTLTPSPIHTRLQGVNVLLLRGKAIDSNPTKSINLSRFQHFWLDYFHFYSFLSIYFKCILTANVKLFAV